MISKVQGKTISSAYSVRKAPALTGLEKAMLKWVTVDPEDRLLDVNVGNGVMAEYLRRNMQCEVCGVSDRMEHVRAARSRLQSCDIVYAPAGDIPWRADAFDTVLMRHDGENEETLRRMLSEALRVLRPGGQLILGAMCYPAAFHAVTGLFADPMDEERCVLAKKPLLALLAEQHFGQITCQRTGLGSVVLIAWKPVGKDHTIE